ITIKTDEPAAGKALRRCARGGAILRGARRNVADAAGNIASQLVLRLLTALLVPNRFVRGRRLLRVLRGVAIVIVAIEVLLRVEVRAADDAVKFVGVRHWILLAEVESPRVKPRAAAPCVRARFGWPHPLAALILAQRSACGIAARIR